MATKKAKSKRETKAEQSLSKTLKKLSSKPESADAGPLTLHGHTADEPTYKEKRSAHPKRFIDIKLENGQTLTVESDHIVADQDIAVVVLEKPQGYSVKIQKD